MKYNQYLKYRITCQKIGKDYLNKQDIMKKCLVKQTINNKVQDQIIRYPFYLVKTDSQQSDTFQQKYTIFWRKFLQLQKQYHINQVFQWILIVLGISIPILLIILDSFIFQKNTCSLRQLQFDCFLNALESYTQGVPSVFQVKQITISFCLMGFLILLITIYKYFYNLFRSIQEKIKDTNIEDLVLEINGFPFEEIFESDKMKKYTVQEAVVLLLQKIIQDEIINNLSDYKSKLGEYTDFAQINRIIIPLNGSQLLTSVRKQIISCTSDSFNPHSPIFVIFNHKKQFESVYKILKNYQNSYKYMFSCVCKQNITKQSYVKLQFSKATLKDIDHKKYFKQKSFTQCHKNVYWFIFILIIAIAFLIACLQENITSWQIGILLQITDFVLQKLTSWYLDSVGYTKTKSSDNHILYSLVSSILIKIFAPFFIWKCNRSQFQLKLQDIVITYSISNALFPQIKILMGLGLAALIQYLDKKYKNQIILQCAKKNFNYDEKLKELQSNGLYFDIFQTTLFTLFFVRIAPVTLIIVALFKIAFRSIIQKLILFLINKRSLSVVNQDLQPNKRGLTNPQSQRRLKPYQKKKSILNQNIRIQTQLNYANYKRFIHYYKYGFYSYVVGTFILLAFYRIWTLDWLPPLLFLLIFLLVHQTPDVFEFGICKLNEFSNQYIQKTKQAINSFDKYLQHQRESLIQSMKIEELYALNLLSKDWIKLIDNYKQILNHKSLLKDQKQQIITYRFKNIIAQDRISELTYKFQNNCLSQQDSKYIVETYTRHVVINQVLKKQTSLTNIKYAINIMSLSEFTKQKY